MGADDSTPSAGGERTALCAGGRRALEGDLGIARSMAAALRIVSHGAQHAPPRTKTDIVPQTLEEPMKRKVMISRKQIELEQQIKMQARAKEQLERKVAVHAKVCARGARAPELPTICP